MLDLMEWHLQVQRRLPNLAGTAQWVFKDFGTPLRPENPIPFVNQKGVVTRDGTPKDIYYLFQAYQTETPVCYIESATWPLRRGEPGGIKRVRVYTNCARVELWVNGRSQGTKFSNPTITPAGGLVWMVPFRAGENRLRAVGWMADGREAEHTITQTLITNGGAQPEQAAALTGWVEPAEAALRITIQLVNAHGVPVLRDERRVHFRLEGAGRLLERQGTPGGSAVIETANGRAAIVLHESESESVIYVSSAGLPECRVVISRNR